MKTRNEALSFRSSIANRSFVLSANETSPSSVVTDTIRRLDYEAARFQKLLGTLPKNIDVTGLHLAEPDLLAILLRSLPEAVRNFVLRHAGGDSYQSFRVAAQRWEQQQRMFQEFHTKKGISQIEDGVEYYDVSGDGGYHIDAVVDDRCTKCGSKKHSTESCQVDISKLKCFRCQEFGHIGANCLKNRGEKGKSKKGSVKGVQKGDRFDKGKSTGKGKKGKSGKGYGKKGKLNEVSWSGEEDSWWYQDNWNYEDQDWSWNVDQVGWENEQYGQDWSWNEEQSWGENSTWNETYENEGREKQKGDGSSPTVGSLTLHAVFREMSEESGVFEHGQQVGALFLQPFSPFPQPFVASAARGSQVGEVSGSCRGLRDLSGLQSGPYSCLGEKSGPLCLGESSRVDVDHVNFHEGLLCDVPRKIKIFRLDERSRLHNVHDTVSFSHEFVRHAMIVSTVIRTEHCIRCNVVVVGFGSGRHSLLTSIFRCLALRFTVLLILESFVLLMVAQ